MKKVLLIVIFCLLLIVGCTNKYNKNNSNDSETNNSKTETKERETKMPDIKVTMNNKTYTLELDNNKAVEELLNLLPQEFNMSELNGNEIYVYMDNSLTTNPYNPKHIKKGDVMLFGDNCLVIFYKTFDTSYSYTKIGHINNLDDLGNESVLVKFEK